MIRKITAVLLVVIAAFIGAKAFSDDTHVLRVAIASNLSTVIDELKSDYGKDNKDVNIVVIPGSSGNLTSQILSGAPYDIFLSADTEYPEKIKDAGLAACDPAIYACGKLVLFTTLKMDISGGITVTARDSVKKVAIANPKTAPYGRAAVAALEKAGIMEAVKGKLVYAENISAVAQYVMTSADIGFLAKSIIFDRGLKKFNVEGVYWVDVDPSLYPKLEQSMVILKKGADNAAAKGFFDYMLSDRAKNIMKKYGYSVEDAGGEK